MAIWVKPFAGWGKQSAKSHAPHFIIWPITCRIAKRVLYSESSHPAVIEKDEDCLNDWRVDPVHQWLAYLQHLFNNPPLLVGQNPVVVEVL